MDQFSGYAQQGALYRQGDSAPSNQGYYNPVQSFLDANKKKIANQFAGIETGTLQYLASQGNQGAAAALSKRQLQEPRPGALATAEDAPVPMMVEPPALPDPDVNDPRTPALMTDNSAANRAVASSGGVLEDPTAAPSAAEAVLSQSNSSDVGNSGVGNRTTGSTAQSTSRSMSPSTGNARGSQMGYGKANTAEMLMRVGGVMQANAINGYGAAMGAASNEYGMIQDQRRAADTAAYEAQEKKDAAKRLADAKVRAARAKAGAKAGAKGMPTAVYKEATLSAITRIKDLLTSESGFNPFDNVTGWTGSLLSSVPGTPAHDALNSINTIEAAVGFDRLQKMRDDSPTGGALGQVTERELALLSQSLGSLKQSSSRPQFVANLNAVEKHYQAAVAAVEAQQAEWYRMNGGTTPTNSTVAPNGAGTTAAPSSDAVQAALDKYK